MSGTFDVHSGVANTNDLKATLDVGNLAAAGTINLVNEALAMHITAVMNKAFSQSVGGNSVGGYDDDRVRQQERRTGRSRDYHRNHEPSNSAPDVQKMAEMKLNNIVPDAAGLYRRQGRRRRNRGGFARRRPATRPGSRQSKPNQASSNNYKTPSADCWAAARRSHRNSPRSQSIIKAARQGGFFLLYGNTCYVPVASSRPCSTFSWHPMQWRVHGTASRRLALISSPQADAFAEAAVANPDQRALHHLQHLALVAALAKEKFLGIGVRRPVGNVLSRSRRRPRDHPGRCGSRSAAIPSDAPPAVS